MINRTALSLLMVMGFLITEPSLAQMSQPVNNQTIPQAQTLPLSNMATPPMTVMPPTVAAAPAPATSPPENYSAVETVETPKKRKEGGLFLEPMLLASKSDTSVKRPIRSGSQDGRLDGVGAGLRLGLHASEVFFIGVDARYLNAKTTQSFYQTAEGPLYEYSPMLGFQMPDHGLRLWGNYVLGGEYNPAGGPGGLDLKFSDPEGYRVGVGMRFASVSANVEYQHVDFDKFEVQSGGPIATGDQTFTTDGWTVSLSFPFEL